MISEIRKYPRTHHLEGSKFQMGDDDLDSVRYESLSGKYVVIEEKLDGANSGISFTDSGDLLLQSRGHYLTGGYRERHFDLFKSWAATHKEELWNLLGDRFIMYGEWLYAKHTVFYDLLPNYFMEFDILDTRDDIFLSTDARHRLLSDSSVSSVPVLYTGELPKAKELRSLISESLYKSDKWRTSLIDEAVRQNLEPEKVVLETDPSDLMEGLYIKCEDKGAVLDRYKFIRSSFLTTVVESGSHWLDRPIVPNALASGKNIFASETRG